MIRFQRNAFGGEITLKEPLNNRPRVHFTLFMGGRGRDGGKVSCSLFVPQRVQRLLLRLEWNSSKAEVVVMGFVLKFAVVSVRSSEIKSPPDQNPGGPGASRIRIVLALTLYCTEQCHLCSSALNCRTFEYNFPGKVSELNCCWWLSKDSRPPTQLNSQSQRSRDHFHGILRWLTVLFLAN